MVKNKIPQKVDPLTTEPVPHNDKKSFLPSLSSTMMTVGIDMFATIVVGTALGWCSDTYWATKPWGVIVGFMLGAGSGFITTYRKLCKIGCGFGQRKTVRSKD